MPVDEADSDGMNEAGRRHVEFLREKCHSPTKDSDLRCGDQNKAGEVALCGWHVAVYSNERTWPGIAWRED